MILSVLYVWCQLNKDQIVSFWFGTRFKVIFFGYFFNNLTKYFVLFGICYSFVMRVISPCVCTLGKGEDLVLALSMCFVVCVFEVEYKNYYFEMGTCSVMLLICKLNLVLLFCRIINGSQYCY